MHNANLLYQPTGLLGPDGRPLLREVPQQAPPPPPPPVDNRSAPENALDGFQPIQPPPVTVHATELVCKFCGHQGSVKTKQVEKGFSIGGNQLSGVWLVLGALVLPFIVLPAAIVYFFLDHKKMVTKAKCFHCGSIWQI
jgi:hypothetical protein